VRTPRDKFRRSVALSTLLGWRASFLEPLGSSPGFRKFCSPYAPELDWRAHAPVQALPSAPLLKYTVSSDIRNWSLGDMRKSPRLYSGCTRMVPSFDKSYRSLGSRKLERSISSLFLKCVREVSKRETVSDRFGGFLNRAPPAQIKSTPHLTNGIFLPGTLGGTLRFHLCPLDANSLAIRPRCMASASAGVTIGIVEVALFAATAGPLAGARITSG
jgi:hypothetical protein